MKLLLIIILILPSLSYSAPGHTLKNEVIYQLLNLFAGDKLTNQMSLILAHHPNYISKTNSIFSISEDLAKKICRVENEPRHTDDEVDAVRHFIGAALLSAYTNPHFAKDLLSAQEMRQVGLNPDNYMDLKNNDSGIKFSMNIFFKREVNPEDINENSNIIYAILEEEALRKIEKGELVAIKTGLSFCSNPSIYPNFKEDESH